MARSKYWGKNAKRAVKREVKKTHPMTFLIPVLFLVLAFVVGYIGAGALFQTDGFSVRGEKQYTVRVGESFTYTDEGFVCTALGRDISDKVSVKSNMTLTDGVYTVDTTKPGEYYISYTCTDSLFYTNVRLVRVISVLEEVEADG